ALVVRDARAVVLGLVAEAVAVGVDLDVGVQHQLDAGLAGLGAARLRVRQRRDEDAEAEAVTAHLAVDAARLAVAVERDVVALLNRDPGREGVAGVLAAGGALRQRLRQAAADRGEGAVAVRAQDAQRDGAERDRAHPPARYDAGD